MEEEYYNEKAEYWCWKHGKEEPGIIIYDARTGLPVAICRQCWLEHLLNYVKPMTVVEEDDQSDS